MDEIGEIECCDGNVFDGSCPGTCEDCGFSRCPAAFDVHRCDCVREDPEPRPVSRSETTRGDERGGCSCGCGVVRWWEAGSSRVWAWRYPHSTDYRIIWNRASEDIELIRQHGTGEWSFVTKTRAVSDLYVATGIAYSWVELIKDRARN